MIKGGTSVRMKGSLMDELDRRFGGKNRVLVGVPKGAGTYEDGTLIAVVAAANEFGATINHPGGTPYGYKTKEDAEAGRVRFLRKGEGVMQIGVTQAHKINIPERPALRTGARAAMPEIKQLSIISIPKINDGSITMEQLTDQMGMLAVGKIQETISSGVGPENTDSTIKKKGSSTPLVDTGHFRQSIRHVSINENEDVKVGL